MKLIYSPRFAVEEDIPSVAAIDSYSNSPAWSQDSFLAEFSKDTSLFLVITDDETDSIIAGYLVASLAGEQIHIQTLAVNRDHRRKGIGKMLLNNIIKQARKRNYKNLVLEVRKGNANAISLYQSYGFIVVFVKSRLYPDGEDGYLMSLKLEEAQDTEEEEAPIDNSADTKSRSNLN